MIEPILFPFAPPPSENDGACRTAPLHAQAQPPARTAVLEVRLPNSAEAMSSLTGFFAQHGLKLDAMIGVPLADETVARLLLLVRDEPRLPEIPGLLADFPGVFAVRQRRDLTPDFFFWMADMATDAPLRDD